MSEFKKKTIHDYFKSGDMNAKVNETVGSLEIFNENGNIFVKVPVENEEQIEEIAKVFSEEIRFCGMCGKPMNKGFTDEDEYSCEDCFEESMDFSFGKGKWRKTEKEGRFGGYYESLENDGTWDDTGVYYTEWN